MAKIPSIPMGMKTAMKSAMMKDGEFCSKLMTAAVQVHIYHLRAKGTGSFAAHLALGDLYDALPDMADSIAESIQGKNGLLTYDATVSFDSNYGNTLSYVKGLLDYVKMTRKEICQDSYVQNQVDSVEEKLYSTIYKLENLS